MRYRVPSHFNCTLPHNGSSIAPAQGFSRHSCMMTGNQTLWQIYIFLFQNNSRDYILKHCVRVVLNQLTGEYLTDKLFGETLKITSKINGRSRLGAKLLSQSSAVHVTSDIPSRLNWVSVTRELQCLPTRLTRDRCRLGIRRVRKITKSDY